MSVREGRTTAARLIAFGLWLLLAASVLAWALFLWHPWIDWFGRPR